MANVYRLELQTRGGGWSRAKGIKGWPEWRAEMNEEPYRGAMIRLSTDVGVAWQGETGDMPETAPGGDTVGGHPEEHVEIAARTAYAAAQGYALLVRAEGYQEGLGYDDLPEYGRHFVRQAAREALAGRTHEPSAKDVGLRRDQAARRDKLFADVVKATVASLESAVSF